MNAIDSTSTRPYLIRALYEWCTDNGLTPYVAVAVDETVQVPREFVKNGEIVLNISYDATSALSLGNEFIEFKARFAGTAREITVPIGRVIAIYARENGQGMAFPLGSLHPGTPGEAGRPAPAAAPAPTRLHAAPDPAQARAEDHGNVVQLGLAHEPPAAVDKPPAGPAESSPPDGEGPVPPRPPSGAPRPSLKRIK